MSNIAKNLVESMWKFEIYNSLRNGKTDIGNKTLDWKIQGLKQRFRSRSNCEWFKYM